MKMSRSFSKVFEEFLRKESLNASLENGAVENEAADTTNDNETVHMELNNETVNEVIETVHMEFNNETVNELLEDNNVDKRLMEESVDTCVLDKTENMSADAEDKSDNMSVDAEAKSENMSADAEDKSDSMSVDAEAKSENMSADAEQKNQSIGVDLENKAVNVKAGGQLAIISRDLEVNKIYKHMIDSAKPIEDEKETSNSIIDVCDFETSSINSDEIENTPPDMISIYINPYYKSPNLGKTNKLKGVSTDNLTNSDSRNSSMKLVDYDSSSGGSQGCSQETSFFCANILKSVKEKSLPSFSDKSQVIMFNYKIIRKGKHKNISEETTLDDGSMVDEFQDGSGTAVNVSSSAREAILMMNNNFPIETSVNVDSIGRDQGSLRSTPLPLPFVKHKTKQTLTDHIVGTQSSSPLTLSPSSVISSSATVTSSSSVISSSATVTSSSQRSPLSLFSSPEIPSSFPVNQYSPPLNPSSPLVNQPSPPSNQSSPVSPSSPTVNQSSPVSPSSPTVNQSSPPEKEASSPVNLSLSLVEEVLAPRDNIVVYSADLSVVRRVKGTRLCQRKCKRHKANSPIESKSVKDESEEFKDESEEAKDESEEAKDGGEVYDEIFSASQDDEELELFSKSQ